MRYLLFFMLIVANWRITRLLIKDTFPPVRILRDWFISTFGARDERTGDLVGGRKGWGTLGYSIAYIWTCPWCMSIYVAAATAGICELSNLDLPYPWLVIAASSGLAGWLGHLDARADQSYDEAERRLGR